MSPTDQMDPVTALLRALGITEIEFSLSGGGDSGEVTLERISYQDGRTEHKVPDVPTEISNTGAVRSLPDVLEQIVADAPEGDWVNNEGGYGTVVIRPFEEDEDLVIDCDMTFREEGDYGDDDDDFVDDDLDEEPGEAANGPPGPTSPPDRDGEVEQ